MEPEIRTATCEYKPCSKTFDYRAVGKYKILKRRYCSKQCNADALKIAHGKILLMDQAQKLKECGR